MGRARWAFSRRGHPIHPCALPFPTFLPVETKFLPRGGYGQKFPRASINQHWLFPRIQSSTADNVLSISHFTKMDTVKGFCNLRSTFIDMASHAPAGTMGDFPVPISQVRTLTSRGAKPELVRDEERTQLTREVP